jgi:hypothetical protein
VAKVSLVDLADITQYRWSAIQSGSRGESIAQIYAIRGTNKGGVHVRTFLHRYIASKMYSMDELAAKTLTFKDGDKLNCTRENLILADKRNRRTDTQIKKVKKGGSSNADKG